MFAVLALELDGPLVRAAVVTRKGLKEFEIIYLETFERLEEENDLLSGEELAMITAKLSSFPQQVVVVSPRVAFIRLAVEAKLLKKMRWRRQKLKALLQTESEAFTGLPAAEALLGFQRAPKVEGQKKVSFWVSSMPAEEYRRWKEALAEHELRLKSFYPPDIAFGTAATLLGGEEGSKEQLLVIDVASGAVRFAWLQQGRLVAYRMVPVGLAQLKAELFACRSWDELGYGEPLETEGVTTGPIIVTGAGAQEEDVVSFLRASFSAEVRPLEILAGNMVSEKIYGGEYASVVGAALRELWYPYLGSRALAISDALPLLQRLGKKAYVIPLAILLFFFVVFGIHYLVIRRQISLAEEELVVLAQQRDAITAAANLLGELEKEAEGLQAKRLLLAAEVDYLQNRLPEYRRLLHSALVALERGAEPGLLYFSIELPDAASHFILSGESQNTAAIHSLALSLQVEKWCAFAKVEEITRIERVERITAEEGGEFAPIAEGEDIFQDLGGGQENELGIAPEQGLEPGEPLFIPDNLTADPPGEPEGEAVETRTVIVYQFRSRVVVRPEFWPERPAETGEEEAPSGRI